MCSTACDGSLNNIQFEDDIEDFTVDTADCTEHISKVS